MTDPVPSRRRRRLALALAVLAVAATGIALKVMKDDDGAETAARNRAELKQREQKELAKLNRQIRTELVRKIEKGITKEARQKVANGDLQGPILRTDCEPSGGAIDIESAGQELSCVAIREPNSGGAPMGYRYLAKADYKEFTYSWRLDR